jgi:flagellar hook assembly protein FlgD
MAGANPAARPALEFTIASSGRVKLAIYDVTGREVTTLVDQDAAAGSFRATWDGRRSDGSAAGSGVYFARLQSNGTAIASKKITLQ